jgi:hypothetical protein
MDLGIPENGIGEQSTSKTTNFLNKEYLLRF